jgi:Flp pilus assembly protein TadG
MRPLTIRCRLRPVRSRGQSLAEFALVFPILFLVVAAIIQFGLIFWAQNTLTQVARDTGRWAATQQDCNPATATGSVIATANAIAGSSSLIGYTAGSWDSTNVQVAWTTETTTPPSTCPPVGNQQVAYVTITLHQSVPMFFPFLPVSNALTTQAQFRMEPVSK